ncbi:hypothetical protein KI387_036642, partial [Taxus chinensis]
RRCFSRADGPLGNARSSLNIPLQRGSYENMGKYKSKLNVQGPRLARLDDFEPIPLPMGNKEMSKGRNCHKNKKTDMQEGFEGEYQEDHVEGHTHEKRDLPVVNDDVQLAGIFRTTIKRKQNDGILDFDENHDDLSYRCPQNMEREKPGRSSSVEEAKAKEGELLVGSPRSKETTCNYGHVASCIQDQVCFGMGGLRKIKDSSYFQYVNGSE